MNIEISILDISDLHERDIPMCFNALSNENTYEILDSPIELFVSRRCYQLQEDYC